MFAPPVVAVCKLREARESLASEDYAALTPAARAELVTALLGEIERLGAEALRCVGQWDAGRDWADDGALSASSWLAHRAAMAKPAATRLVRTARLAFRNVRTGKALAAGDVSVPQVEVLAAVARGRERLYERDEDTLLDAAPALTVDDFTTVARYWRSAADDELSRLDAFCAFEARSITMATALDGRVVVQCSFDAEGAEIVSAALDAYDRPDPECSDGPVRTLGQRRADALVQICSEALGGASGARRHTPTIDGVIDLSRLGHGAPLDLLSRCEIVGIGPVPRVVIERMACDARVGRIVMRGRSEVLDVGRRTRVVPPALRRAIVHRDRHCTFPGCTAPPEWCDVHHCTHWVDGGETNLANCVLLCRRHHVTCHEGGWRLARAPDGTVEISERGTAVRRRRSPP